MARTDTPPQIELIAYTVEQTAAALGTDKERVSLLIRAGVIPHVQFGTRWVIGKRALDEWLTRTCLANASRAPESVPSRPTPLRRRTSRVQGGSSS